MPRFRPREEIYELLLKQAAATPTDTPVAARRLAHGAGIQARYAVTLVGELRAAGRWPWPPARAGRPSDAVWVQYSDGPKPSPKRRIARTVKVARPPRPRAPSKPVDPERWKRAQHVIHPANPRQAAVDATEARIGADRLRRAWRRARKAGSSAIVLREIFGRPSSYGGREW